MEADRNEMTQRLSEIYNYNSYNVQTANPVEAHAPYNNEQHQAFLYKFSFYLKDVLRQMDASLNSAQSVYYSIVSENLDGVETEEDVLKF